MVMEAVPEDPGDGSVPCTLHPFKTHTTPPGGICALCLQDKLGKLVTSSFPSSIFPSTSSSSHSPSPSERAKPSFPQDKGGNIVFQRSKSTAVTRFGNDEFSPRKKGFWSFFNKGTSGTSFRQRSVNGSACDDERRVARSRSVGCGSRSFSGDFFERISTFGDCTLRRVESQRVGKVKNTPVHSTGDRVKCGGLFGGFAHAQQCTVARVAAHGRTRSWGWAFASPMRAFSSKRESGNSSSKKNTNATPNLGAIPSLLAVGGGG